MFPATGARRRTHTWRGAYVSVRDPEGNRIELFVDTPWYVQQPLRIPMDMNLPDPALGLGRGRGAQASGVQAGGAVARRNFARNAKVLSYFGSKLPFISLPQNSGAHSGPQT
jgi:hypothetical protein